MFLRIYCRESSWCDSLLSGHTYHLLPHSTKEAHSLSFFSSRISKNISRNILEVSNQIGCWKRFVKIEHYQLTSPFCSHHTAHLWSLKKIYYEF